MAIDRTPAGRQHVLPGMERTAGGELARVLTAAPIRPALEQRPCDFGLFADRQLDLVDMSRTAPTVPNREE